MELNPQKYCFLWNIVNMNHKKICKFRFLTTLFKTTLLKILFIANFDLFSAFPSVTFPAEHLAVLWVFIRVYQVW